MISRSVYLLTISSLDDTTLYQQTYLRHGQAVVGANRWLARHGSGARWQFCVKANRGGLTRSLWWEPREWVGELLVSVRPRPRADPERYTLCGGAIREISL